MPPLPHLEVGPLRLKETSGPAPILLMAHRMMKIRHILITLALALSGHALLAQKAIYAYAIGDWRNGPVVQISPLIKTTEMFTGPQLIKWVRTRWPEQFTATTDIDVQFFGTLEEGELSRQTLKSKYGVRKLEVNMLESAEMPRTPERPE